MEYVKRLRRALAENRIPFDGKKFKPHVTLVRKGWFEHGPKFPEYMPEMQTTATSVALIKSELGKDGSIYTVLGEVSCR